MNIAWQSHDLPAHTLRRARWLDADGTPWEAELILASRRWARLYIRRQSRAVTEVWLVSPRITDADLTARLEEALTERLARPKQVLPAA